MFNKDELMIYIASIIYKEYVKTKEKEIVAPNGNESEKVSDSVNIFEKVSDAVKVSVGQRRHPSVVVLTERCALI